MDDIHGTNVYDFSLITVLVVDEVCGICMKQDDNCDGVEVEWMECTKCKLWVHAACISDFYDDDYLCLNCLN